MGQCGELCACGGCEEEREKRWEEVRIERLIGRSKEKRESDGKK